VPKEVSGLLEKSRIFSMLYIYDMRTPCRTLLTLLELSAFRILNFIYVRHLVQLAPGTVMSCGPPDLA
jgi:hypothetical protein